MTDTARQDRTEWALLGAMLLVLGIALCYMLYADRQHIDESERDRLQSQARVMDDNLGRQIEAVNQALLEIQGTLAPSHRRDGEHSQAHLLAVLRRAIPGVRQMARVRADGTVAASSQAAAVDQSHAGWAYFERARARRP